MSDNFKGREIIKGRTITLDEAIDWGVLPEDFRQFTKSESDLPPMVSTVTHIDREKGEITFDVSRMTEKELGPSARDLNIFSHYPWWRR